MPMSFLIYGAGGHANVLAELGSINGATVPVMFSDDAQHHSEDSGMMICAYDPFLFPTLPLVLGIGNNKVRELLASKVGHTFTRLIHPKAVVATDALIGEGTVVLANAVIQANCRVGNHVIINAGAVIDHDATISDFAHVAANAYIGGGAVIEKNVLIGQGAVVTRHTIVKEGTVIPPLSIVEPE